MLTELRIVNVGVIDDAVLELGPGFTAVTGETGAGKTMVVTGLGLLLGGKGEARLIRHGAARAVVEGRLTATDAALVAAVDALGGELDGDELLLARQVTPSRSRSFVGGAQVPTPAAAELMAERVTIHGQSEQLRLATPERQRQLLDDFMGADGAAALARYASDYATWRAARTELDALVSQAAARSRELDALTFGLDEIAAVDPVPDEDATLAAEANRLQAVDDLRLSARAALVALAGDEDSSEEAPDAIGLLAVARKAAQLTAERDASATEIAQGLADVGYQVNDLAGRLSSYLASLEADPLRLEWIAGRRAQLQGLTRKYGTDINAVLAWSAESAARVAELSSSDERIAGLRENVQALESALTAQASVLTALRVASATTLSNAVKDELAALALPHARLEFVVTSGDKLGPTGVDSVALLFSANPGSALGPLGRVASGGELSRVRLALEVVLATGSEGQTFVFDEVDAGVGGATALEIGRRLARLAEHAQVIVVTHLAQVAAFADRHYVVIKADDGQVTTSGIAEVAGDGRVSELARMMAGLESSKSSRAHAAELLAEASRKS